MFGVFEKAGCLPEKHNWLVVLPMVYPQNMVDCPMKNGDVPYFFVCLPEITRGYPWLIVINSGL